MYKSESKVCISRLKCQYSEYRRIKDQLIINKYVRTKCNLSLWKSMDGYCISSAIFDSFFKFFLFSRDSTLLHPSGAGHTRSLVELSFLSFDYSSKNSKLDIYYNSSVKTKNIA